MNRIITNLFLYLIYMLMVYAAVIFIVSKVSGAGMKVNVKLSEEAKQYQLILQIEKDFVYSLRFYKRRISSTNFKKVLKMLYVAETKYGIHYKDLLGIIGTESEFKIRALNKNKSKRKKKVTYDYGLTQQNSRHIKKRYRMARKHLSNLNLKGDIKNVYDVNLNMLSAILYLKSIKKHVSNYKQFVSSYNTGLKGYYLYPKRAKKYFKRFYKLRKHL